MPRLVLLTSTLFLLLGLVACAGESQSSNPPPESEPEQAPSIPFDKEGELTFIRDGSPMLTIDVEIADTDSTRERGLMARESLPEQSGMLFIFDYEAEQSFWMSNTPLSLDLLYINSDSVIVSMSKYATPFSPDPIRSLDPAKFVVELEAGMADTYGLLEGDRVRWTRID